MPETSNAHATALEEFARLAVDEASERLGSDIVLLDIRDAASFADFFVIASGETDRHLEGMANDLTRKLRTAGLHIGHREGTGAGGWILLDFGGLIVHLFTRQQREKYGLERLWNRATEVVRIQ